PDDPLLEAAERGTLHEPVTLETHVKRMIADDRSSALVDNFAVQWLGLRQLRPVTLDAEIFTEYDGNLRDAFLQETQRFVRDPLGFALENFDAIGRWRTTGETGEPIDAAGALPDSTTFRGVSGVRTLVTSRPEEFVRVLTGKLMTYALGRAVDEDDMPAIRAV